MTRPRFLSPRPAGPMSVLPTRRPKPFQKWSVWQKRSALAVGAVVAVVLGGLAIRALSNGVWSLVSVIK